MQLNLSPPDLAKRLSLPRVELRENLCAINVPITIRRRCIEMKIVAGDLKSSSDPTLIRALCNAHDWMPQMKTGTSVKQIVSATSISECYITRILPVAFLSPRIQQAIPSGSQPPMLTHETFALSRVPMDWFAQERLFGFAPNN